ncbi:TerD family protein [Streptomyces sp. NPDC005435]|uniref:TerD family protein n=1 Tax=Streptomyces sp. NPDC005435 TaxID=3154464 RepID=UPI003451F2EF
MTGFGKGIRGVEVALKWNPSPAGRPPSDLDLVAAVFTADDAYGQAAHLVHFDSRSPDGTIFLNRDSPDGKGFGWDEVMTLELHRLDRRYARVVVGVVIRQEDGTLTFGQILAPALRVRTGYTDLTEDDFTTVPDATAATVAEFVRDGLGEWSFRAGVHGFAEDPTTFTRLMGRVREA